MRLSIHFSTSFNTVFFRLGYKSSGGFAINSFVPVPVGSLKPIAPAYRIHASGQKLDGKSVLGKSDPFFIFSRVESNGKLTKLYRSEAVKEDLNPNWKYFELNMCDLGGMDNDVVIECYDWNANGFHDLIGKTTTTFREFTFGSFQFALVNPKKVGRYVICMKHRNIIVILYGRVGYQTSGAFSVDRIEPLREEIIKPLAPTYKLSFAGTKLDAKDVSLTSDPFFELFSTTPPGRKLYRSEVVMKNLNPTWKPFDVSVAELGGVDVPFTVKVYDWDEDGSHDCILLLTHYERTLIGFSDWKRYHNRPRVLVRKPHYSLVE